MDKYKREYQVELKGQQLGEIAFLIRKYLEEKSQLSRFESCHLEIALNHIYLADAELVRYLSACDVRDDIKKISDKNKRSSKK